MSRATWLLFYLAYYGEWMSRDDLSFFLRPDADVKTGRQYLRRLLSDAKKFPWARDLEVEYNRLRWHVDTDVSRFQDAAHEGRWFEAVQLYRGPFLQGLNAGYLPSYEAWLQGEHEVLEHLWHSCMVHYAADLESSGQHHDATGVAERLLQHDSLDEEALRSFVRNAYLSGQHKRALDAAATFRQELQNAFGMEPTQATLDLVATVRAAEPLEKRVTSRKYGRRREDSAAAAPSKVQDELVKLLHAPGSRLVTLGSSRGHTTITVTKRVPQAHTALAAILELAEQLTAAQHHGRALELVVLALNHPECDVTLKKRAWQLWSTLTPHLAFTH